MTSEEIGTHYYQSGDFHSASKSHQRARDYCTTPKHVTEISLRLIQTAIAQRNWMGVQNQVTKIQTSTLKGDEKAKLEPVLSALNGLAYLQQGQYGDAAHAFLQTPAAYAAAPEPDATAKIVFQ